MQRLQEDETKRLRKKGRKKNMNEYYRFFNLDETATDEEIEARYKELKKKYEEDRWLDGEAGNEGAQNLTKLETAYAEIKRAERNGRFEFRAGRSGESAARKQAERGAGETGFV